MRPVPSPGIAAVLAALLAVALAGCADAPVAGSGSARAASGAPAPAAGAATAAPLAPPGPGDISPNLPPVMSPVTSPVPTTGDERALPVYYVARTASGPRLQREFRRLSAADPAGAAVSAMLAAPTGTDPDYQNPWPAGTTLRAPVTATGDAITVDLSAAPPSDLAAQQLVFTAQGALRATTPVLLLHDGAPTGPPIRRADQYTVRSLVQIDNPAEGGRSGSPLTVTGEAAVVEATLHWTVERDGTTVARGVASTARGQAFAPFRFSVPLPSGRYVVRISEGGGAGRPVFTDDKSVTVT